MIFDKILLKKGLIFYFLFISNYFRDQCRKFGINVNFIPKWTPRTNMVERYHRTLNTALAIFANENHRTWDTDLKYILFALRNTVSEVTKYTPSELTYGRKMRMPYNLFKEIDDGNLIEFDAEAHKEYLDEYLRHIFGKAAKAVNTARKRAAQRFNAHRRESNFKEGQWVMRRYHGKSKGAERICKKFLRKYVGPNVINKVYSGSQVNLKTLDGEDLGRWPTDQLKPFF